MQPEYGSEKYKEQVESIFTMVSNTDCKMSELDKFLMPFILDMDYHRGAICEARKKLLEIKEEIK
ncbi:MAG: hypothetical protein PHP92_03390 [Candidatus Nanoarchaeia archaeon]|nr:hypothetical protein [Candidatus Nanoarchaeia archaeon]